MKRGRIFSPWLRQIHGAARVCIATSGPRGIHLLNGLYDARRHGAPVLAISAHALHDLISTSLRQEVDFDKLCISVGGI